ncbi:nematode cuticle collagen domain protein, partial [Cooperia oncophora]
MTVEKQLVTAATAASIAALTACVIVLPGLYRDLVEIHGLVMDTVAAFRLETDSAWNEMRIIHARLLPPSRPHRNPFTSIFRSKKHSLPAWCICEPMKIDCPPGPVGPPGPAGLP